MKFFNSTPIFVFLTVVFFLAACGSGENANQLTNQTISVKNNANANLSKDDVEEFGKIVNLPAKPEEVTWREIDSQKTKKLIAVLKFSARDAQVVAEQAEKHKAVETIKLDAEDWFPPELIAKSQESGDESLKGSAYQADDFLQNPYKNGRLARIGDSDYFVLELTADK